MRESKSDRAIMVQLKINEQLYLRDPQSSELGQKIVLQSVHMISGMGFEQFTFKKLAKEISSTEASVYRYFENKHKLLIYLISWYWNWLSYRLGIETLRIEDPKEKLKIGIELFCHTLGPLPNTRTPLDLQKLQQIVNNESPKAYLTKEVDADNKEGSFLAYKRFCRVVASFVKEINSDYAYPTALISTAVEAAHHQKYFSEHLPSLTEVSKREKSKVASFLEDMIFRVIQ
ncbi:MAG: TetR/AcrR family transcriptional regulator [Bacteroidota bacterium]